MEVRLPYLNSIDLRDLSQPYSTDYAGQEYVKKFAYLDFIHVQLSISGFVDYIECRASLVDMDGVEVKTLPFTTSNVTGYEVVDLRFQLNQTALVGGCYRLRVELWDDYDAAHVYALQSEPFRLVGTDPADSFSIRDEEGDSIRIKATHAANAFGTFFLNDDGFEYRVEGGFEPKCLTPGSNDTIFEGQNAQDATLYSMPYETYRLLIGGKRGIPDAFIKKLNRAFSLDTIEVDGVRYTKTEGAKLEPIEAEYYPFRSWAITLKRVEDDPFVATIREGADVEYYATWLDFVCVLDEYGDANGTAAATKLQVDKQREGISIGGYPKVYDMLAQFWNTSDTRFPAITAAEWARTSVGDRVNRERGFIGKVNEAWEPSFDVEDAESNEPEQNNVTMCPIPVLFFEKGYFEKGYFE